LLVEAEHFENLSALGHYELVLVRPGKGPVH
jgi:hypothetical protein